MKNIYFGIKYHPDNSNRPTIEAFEQCFKKHNFHSYCVVRDMELWGEATFSAQDIMQETFKRIDTADLVVIDVTEKGVGLGIEAGYAKAKNKKLVITAKAGTDISTTMQGTADHIIQYNEISEIFQQYPHRAIL